MAVAGVTRRLLGLNLTELIVSSAPGTCQVQQKRCTQSWRLVEKPKPGVDNKSYRRIVHFKDEYTVEPLQVTNLAGRDPVTGRLVAKGIGGGIKHKYHWIQWIRDGPIDSNEPPKEEQVLEVFRDGCRTSFVALVGDGLQLKYILATENMKPGQILKTSKAIPRMPVRAFEGDCYPLGALPIGTRVNCVEKYPGFGGMLIHAAGTCGEITRKDGLDRVVVRMPSKKSFSLHKTCMACVGKLSNIDHGSTHIGSAQRNRELGNRPRSGLWQRKGGRHGRKIYPLPPVRSFDAIADKYSSKPINMWVSEFNTNDDAIRTPLTTYQGHQALYKYFKTE